MEASKRTEPRIFKIIVVGDSNVGKTCLTYRFVEERFPSNTEATIGVDFREKRVQVDTETIRLQIWDTAGQERFRKSMVSHYYRNAAAVIFVYDVTCEQSFRNIPKWITEADQHILHTDVPRLLVGTKNDLESQEVIRQRAQRFADANFLPLFEVSAKSESSQSQINAIFLTVAHKLKQQKPLIPNPPGQPVMIEWDEDSRSSCCG